MTATDAVLALVSLLVYIATIATASRYIARDPELTEREQFRCTLMVWAVPVLGVLMWIVVSPTQAWRILARNKDAAR